MKPIELNAAERKLLAMLTAAAHAGAKTAGQPALPCGLSPWAPDVNRLPVSGYPAALPCPPEAGDRAFPRRR
jgi:hypothetical protein